MNDLILRQAVYSSTLYFIIASVLLGCQAAPAADPAAPVPATSVGIQKQKLLADDKQPAANFGSAVALSVDGHTVLIGAHDQSDSGTSTRANGAAYVYAWSGTSFIQQAKLLASDPMQDANFGSSVALSTDGNTAIVGAANHTEGGLKSSGTAYVYARSGTTWTEQKKLLASDKASMEWFGFRVALTPDGHTAFITALEDSDPTGMATRANGAVYIFE